MKEKIKANQKAKNAECKEFRRIIKRQSALLNQVYDNIAKLRCFKMSKTADQWLKRIFGDLEIE